MPFAPPYFPPGYHPPEYFGFAVVSGSPVSSSHSATIWTASADIGAATPSARVVELLYASEGQIHRFDWKNVNDFQPFIYPEFVNAQIAFQPVGGGMAVVYEDIESKTKLSYSLADWGHSWSEPETIAEGATFPCIAINVENGDEFVGYYKEESLFLRRRKFGEAWTTLSPIGTGTPSWTVMEVGYSMDHPVVVAYSVDSVIYIRFSEDYGISWSPRIRVGDGTTPQLVLDQNSPRAYVMGYKDGAWVCYRTEYLGGEFAGPYTIYETAVEGAALEMSPQQEHLLVFKCVEDDVIVERISNDEGYTWIE